MLYDSQEQNPAFPTCLSSARPDIHSLKAHVALFLLLAPSNTVKGRNQSFQLFPVLLMLSVLGAGLVGSYILSFNSHASLVAKQSHRWRK